ncbi:hypothetical protein COV18_01095 [Candidatus Woesearchaeota archaeon CG10_big_fil_rev_8_21_14_0_10_37_12]|nr:MAG: hypothetical protein COV18_01095 [Candidatus Woesearchaeota archaeon CG10_big_fil_rev_8_21_14_0_10_37_12]
MILLQPRGNDSMDELTQVITALKELEEDTSTPKSVRLKATSTIKLLAEECEKSLKVSRALQELETVTEDINVQSYTRMQLLNIVSLLEGC